MDVCQSPTSRSANLAQVDMGQRKIKYHHEQKKAREARADPQVGTKNNPEQTTRPPMKLNN